MNNFEFVHKKLAQPFANFFESVLPDDVKEKIIEEKECPSIADLDLTALFKIVHNKSENGKKNWSIIVKKKGFYKEGRKEKVIFNAVRLIRNDNSHIRANHIEDLDNEVQELVSIIKFLKIIKAEDSLIKEAETLKKSLHKILGENPIVEMKVTETKVKSILTKRYRIRDLKGLRDDSNEYITPYSDNYVEPICYGDPTTDPLVWFMDDEIHKQDMRKFINFFKQNRENAEIFKGIHIFKALTPSDYDVRVIASNNNVLLDSPSKETGLKVLVQSSKIFAREDCEEGPYYLIDSIYENLGVPYEDFVSFAKTLGVACKLSDIFVNVTIPIDDECEYIDSTSDLELLLKYSNRNTLLSKLIWDYFIKTDKDCKWFYKVARKKEGMFIDISRRKDDKITSLMKSLKKTKWVPQTVNTGFLFVKPKKAQPELLPQDFKFGDDPTWLEIIGCDACKNLRG